MLIGRLSPASFAGAPPTEREGVLAPPAPLPLVPALGQSVSERMVLLMFPGSARFLNLNETQ